MSFVVDFLFVSILDNLSQKIYDVNMKDINIDKIMNEVKELEHKTDFVISWFAKKYNKTIFRAGNLDHIGCRAWKDHKGNKLLCFFDPIINRYTTAINPKITYKRKVN